MKAGGGRDVGESVAPQLVPAELVLVVDLDPDLRPALQPSGGEVDVYRVGEVSSLPNFGIVYLWKKWVNW